MKFLLSLGLAGALSGGCAKAVDHPVTAPPAATMGKPTLKFMLGPAPCVVFGIDRNGKLVVPDEPPCPVVHEPCREAPGTRCL